MAFFLYLVIALVTIFLILLLKALRINQHWKNHGIPGPRPLPFFGNMLPTILGTQPTGEIFREIYAAFPNEPAVGYYHFLQPRLLIRDGDIIDRIFIKDFAYFPYRAGSADVVNDPLNSNLFNLSGNLWRAVRAKFAPMFTTGKLRHMQPLISSVGNNFINFLDKTKKRMGALDRIKTYTIDVISTTAFGIEPGPMEDEDNEFRSRGRDVIPPNLLYFLKFQMIFLMPVLAQKLGINFSPPQHTTYFTEAIKSVIRHRRENKTVRNDFVQSMITLQEKGKIEVENPDQGDDYLKIDDEGLKIDPTDDLLAGQAYGFLLAGFDATAIGLTMMIYDLATNPEVQEKARAEVRKTNDTAEGKISYDNLKEMTYLEAFMKESTRMNSTVPFLMRKCIKRYHIPEIGYTLAAGENIMVSSEGIHMDPNYYPEPENLLPERWAPEDVRFQSNRFLPFGYGPRICIGMRLALTESKTLLAKLLLNYKISLDPSTELPIKRNTVSFFNEPKTQIWFKFDKLSQQ